MTQPTAKRYLFSPLDWGLGHAARCIPIIRDLLSNGNEVIVFASPALNQYLQQRFPNLLFIEDSLPPFSYGHQGLRATQLLSLAWQMFRRTRTEHSICLEICSDIKPDVIISDNRYGFYHPIIHSVLITHQLKPIVPKAFRLFQCLVKSFLRTRFRRFNQVQIPDYTLFPGLAGSLSHPHRLPANAIYIGPLSRFMTPVEAKKFDRKPMVLMVTSGPARHRQEMPSELLPLLSQFEVVVLGAHVPETKWSEVTCITSPSDDEIAAWIQKSDIIVGRFGYSLLMDLLALNRSAVLIPTPGQTEQVYLATINGDKMVVANDLNDAVLLFKDFEALKKRLSHCEEVIRQFKRSEPKIPEKKY